MIKGQLTHMLQLQCKNAIQRMYDKYIQKNYSNVYFQVIVGSGLLEET